MVLDSLLGSTASWMGLGAAMASRLVPVAEIFLASTPVGHTNVVFILNMIGKNLISIVHGMKY